MRIRRRPAFALIALFVIVVVALVALGLFLSPARIKAAAIARVEEASGYDLEIARARAGLAWPALALKLDGLVLRNPGRAAEDPLLRLAHLDIGVEILPLLRREVRVSSLVLVRPAVFLVKDARGVMNGAILAPPGASTAHPAGARSGVLLLAAPAARVTGGTLRYVDESGRSEIVVTDIDGVLEARLAPDTVRVRVAFAAGGVRADMTRAGGAAYGPLPIALRADLAHAPASGTTLVRGATFQLAAIDLRADGRIETPPAAAGDSAPATVDLVLASGDFAPDKVLSLLGRSLPAGLEVGGRARMVAAVRGPVAAPEIRGALMLAGVDVTPPGRSSPILTIVTGEAAFTRADLELRDVRGTCGGAPFALSATVTDWARPRVAGRLAGRARLADIATLLPLAPGAALDGGTVAVDVDFATRAPKFADALELTGTAAGDSIAARLPGLPVPVRDLVFTARFTGRRATCEPFRMTLGRSDLAGRITLVDLDPPLLDVALRADRLDVDELLARPAGAPPAGPATARAKAAPPVPPLRGTLSARELIYRQLTARDATLRLTLDRTGFRADDVHAALLGGQLGGDVAIDLAAPDSVRYRSHLVVSGAEANALLSATTPLKELVSGRLDARLDLDGVKAGATPPLALLTALGDVTVTDGRLAVRGPLEPVARQMGLLAAGGDQIEFQRLAAVFRVEQGRVFFRDTRIGSARAGEFDLSGSVGFDGTLDYAVAALLPKRYLPPDIARREEWVAALADASGRVPVDFEITGTVREPRVRVDTRKIEERLATELGRQLREKVDAETARQLDRAVQEAARGLERLLGKKKAAPAESAAGGRPR